MSDIIEAEYKDPEADVDRLLSEMPEGYRVQIKRLEPEWCNGVVAMVDYDPSEPVSSKWIVNRFGGRKYQIKVLDERSRYKAVRTITFPEPPLKDGAPIMPGPNGSYILASEGIVKEPPPAALQDNPMVGVLEKILAAQTAQATQMQTMLLGRVQGLETLLTTKLTEPAPATNPAVVPADPQSQLKQTLETVQAIEELKNVIGSNEIADGAEPENPLYGAIIEKLVDKFTSESTPKPTQPQRQLPPGPIAPASVREPSDLELATMVKERLKTLPDDQRQTLLSLVFEDEEEETPSITGQADSTEIESLLTPEDREQLRNENETENEGQTISPRDVSAVT